MSLKKITITGLTWSFTDNFIKLFINFIVGVILARLLEPREFGLVGMTTIVINISQSFVDSGFTQALIRKKDCSQTDYSTVFFFNLITGIFFYFLLFFSAGSISLFFNEPKLTSIIQVLSISLIINAMAIVQRAKLVKEINFKLQTKISVIATTISGIIGIWAAYEGFGVWSLVIKTLIGFALASLLFWVWNNWYPSLVFSKKSFVEMFTFGSKLLISGLINTIYINAYLLIIGKYFSASELGYYTRADQFKNLPSQNVANVIQKVSYPVLSTIQDDKQKLKSVYKKFIKSSMLITFFLMLTLIAVSKPFILTLIGEKWLPSVIYLRLLSIVGMFYPLHALNLDMLMVQGRSDLFLRLEIIKKTLAIPAIIFGIFYGIQVMILGMIVNSLIAYYLNSYWSGKFIGYSFIEQVSDIIPAFIIALSVSISIFFIGSLLDVSNFLKLIIQLSLGLIIFISIAEITKMADYLYIKEIIFEKIRDKRSS